MSTAQVEEIKTQIMNQIREPFEDLKKENARLNNLNQTLISSLKKTIADSQTKLDANAEKYEQLKREILAREIPSFVMPSSGDGGNNNDNNQIIEALQEEVAELKKQLIASENEKQNLKNKYENQDVIEIVPREPITPTKNSSSSTARTLPPRYPNTQSEINNKTEATPESYTSLKKTLSLKDRANNAIKGLKRTDSFNALKNLNCARTPNQNREENYAVENVEIEPRNSAEISVSLDESNNPTVEKTPKRRSLMEKLVDTLTRSSKN